MLNKQLTPNDITSFINKQIDRRFGSLEMSFRSSIRKVILQAIYLTQMKRSIGLNRLIKTRDVVNAGISFDLIQMITLDMLDTLEMYYVPPKPNES